jgi:hypothetical protein
MVLNEHFEEDGAIARPLRRSSPMLGAKLPISWQMPPRIARLLAGSWPMLTSNGDYPSH